LLEYIVLTNAVVLDRHKPNAGRRCDVPASLRGTRRNEGD
jgi:hypothetical protein